MHNYLNKTDCALKDVYVDFRNSENYILHTAVNLFESREIGGLILAQGCFRTHLDKNVKASKRRSRSKILYKPVQQLQKLGFQWSSLCLLLYFRGAKASYKANFRVVDNSACERVTFLFTNCAR